MIDNASTWYPKFPNFCLLFRREIYFRISTQVVEIVCLAIFVKIYFYIHKLYFLAIRLTTLFGDKKDTSTNESTYNVDILMGYIKNTVKKFREREFYRIHINKFINSVVHLAHRCTLQRYFSWYLSLYLEKEGISNRFTNLFYNHSTSCWDN